MLLFFDVVRDDEGVDTAADGFIVTVAVINLRFVDGSDDKAVNDVNSDADDCDGKGVMANDVDVVVVEFVVDNNGDDKTDVNVIDDVLSDDVDFNAVNAADGVSGSADDVNASADDDGAADVEIAVKTLAVAVNLANSESGSVSVDCEVDPEPEPESEPDPEPERDRELEPELLPRRYRRKPRRLCFGFGLG